MALNVGNMLPAFAVVEDAAHHDSKRAATLCSELKDGDVLLADRAYVDLAFLFDLAQRGIFFVLREKKNMVFTVLEERTLKDPRILSDQIVRMSRKGSDDLYPETLRRVTAIGDAFITNNFKWSPRTIAELCRARWSIEVFFKELKHVTQWKLSFSRLAGTVRAAIWMKCDLLGTLRAYGTAGGPRRPVIIGKQLYFQGFEPFSSLPTGC